ncbi:MAG: hypothetical protein RQ751_00755 [Longimicrobiales bacterium]|nr:hypothetical protein [Longimicrobiales bacterium]
MAEHNEEIMAFVRKEMDKNPGIPTKELYARAQAAVKAAKDLTMRQFHARYPLQIKRQESLAAGGGRSRRRGARRGRRSAAATAAARAAVRTALLKFATDLSAADERKDLVQLMARIDDYVDNILKAAKA